MTDVDLMNAVWLDGYGRALQDMAERADALDVSWRPIVRRSSEQVIAERVARAERIAANGYQRMGKPAGWRYRGGAVDWHTGLPAGSACAWFRRRQGATQTEVAA